MMETSVVKNNRSKNRKKKKVDKQKPNIKQQQNHTQNT